MFEFLTVQNRQVTGEGSHSLDYTLSDVLRESLGSHQWCTHFTAYIPIVAHHGFHQHSSDYRETKQLRSLSFPFSLLYILCPVLHHLFKNRVCSGTDESITWYNHYGKTWQLLIQMVVDAWSRTLLSRLKSELLIHLSWISLKNTLKGKSQRCMVAFIGGSQTGKTHPLTETRSDFFFLGVQRRRTIRGSRELSVSRVGHHLPGHIHLSTNSNHPLKICAVCSMWILPENIFKNVST